MNEEFLRDRNGFVEAASVALLEREREALWLKLVLLRRGDGSSWREGLLVAKIGCSVRFLEVHRAAFPCVTPRLRVAILLDGTFRMANSSDALALQGFRKPEMNALALPLLSDTLLNDLAANSFNANVVAAVLMATLALRRF